MSAHTPGPWTLDPASYIESGLVREDGESGRDGYHIVDAGSGSVRLDGFHIAACITKADARLVAASPDLLDALEHFVRWAEAPKDIWNERPKLCLDRARAAIAKAKGSP